MTDPERDLSWVDEFWSRAGEHIFARREDGALILPPNRVYRANSSAADLVAYLKSGASMARLDLPSDEARRDTARFFGDLAALYRGDAPENGTVGQIPYDFSFTRLPVLAELAVTYRCNNACRFCYAGCGVDGQDGAQAAAAHRPERSTGDFKSIIDIFADRARVPFFSFTGGEPLLRADLEELVAYAKKRGLSTNLVTNGTLIDRGRAKGLKKAGLGSAQVSVEAPIEALHDDLTGRGGAFGECLGGIGCLLAAGIPTQTNTTITRDNMDVTEDMPAFLASIGIKRFAMNLFIPTVAGPEADRLFVPYGEIGAVVDRVARAARRADMTFYWYSPTPFCAYNPIARGFGNKSCAAADGLLSVAPDGAVLPCSSWDDPLGNLFDLDFDDLWFSGAASFYKEKRFAPEACVSCSSFTACQGACPLYWRYAAETPPIRSSV